MSTDTTIEQRLRQLGVELDVPRVETLAADVVAALDDAPAGAGGRRSTTRPGRTGRRPRLAAAAAVVVLLAGGVLAMPSTRRAAARWLGVGDLRVEVVLTLPRPNATLGPALSLDEAAAAAGVRPLVTPLLGGPRSFHAPAGRYVAARYLDAGNEVLVTTTAGRLGDRVGKQVTAATEVEPTTVGDVDALWISGADHTLSYVTADGAPSSIRLSSDVLVWQHGDVMVRVEGARSLERALAIAESVVEA